MQFQGPFIYINYSPGAYSLPPPSFTHSVLLLLGCPLAAPLDLSVRSFQCLSLWVTHFIQLYHTQNIFIRVNCWSFNGHVCWRQQVSWCVEINEVYLVPWKLMIPHIEHRNFSFDELQHHKNTNCNHIGRLNRSSWVFCKHNLLTSNSGNRGSILYTWGVYTLYNIVFIDVLFKYCNKN